MNSGKEVWVSWCVWVLLEGERDREGPQQPLMLLTGTGFHEVPRGWGKHAHELPLNARTGFDHP